MNHIALYILYIFVGLFSGFFTGAVGIGAGVLMIPLLNHLGMSLGESVATGLVIQLIPQSIFGAYEYYKKGKVIWLNTLLVLIGSSYGIYLGSLFNTKKIIPKKYLYLILSILLFISSIYIYIKHVIYHAPINITN